MSGCIPSARGCFIGNRFFSALALSPRSTCFRALEEIAALRNAPYVLRTMSASARRRAGWSPLDIGQGEPGGRLARHSPIQAACHPRPYRRQCRFHPDRLSDCSGTSARARSLSSGPETKAAPEKGCDQWLPSTFRATPARTASMAISSVEEFVTCPCAS